MFVLSQRLLNCPIMSLQTGTEIGRTVEAIIDPRRLTIVAFTCEGVGIDFTPALLHTGDIREFGSMGMIVDGSDDIMPPDDLVRMQEVLNFHFQLMDKPVVDELGQKLGKVTDYTAETKSFYIMQLHVRPPFLRSFGAAELVVNRTQISEITDKQIVINSGMSKSHEARMMSEQSKGFENPFRGRAQPETTHAQSVDER